MEIASIISSAAALAAAVSAAFSDSVMSAARARPGLMKSVECIDFEERLVCIYMLQEKI